LRPRGGALPSFLLELAAEELKGGLKELGSLLKWKACKCSLRCAEVFHLGGLDSGEMCGEALKRCGERGKSKAKIKNSGESGIVGGERDETPALYHSGGKRD